MRYVPVGVSGDVGAIEFGVVQAVLFPDALAVEFRYRGPWRPARHDQLAAPEWELTDAVTGRRLRPTGGGIGGSDGAARGEQWWEDLGHSTRLRLHLAGAGDDLDLDLDKGAPVDPTIRLVPGPSQPDVDSVENIELARFNRNLGPLVPDRVRSIDQPPIRISNGRITPLALVEWGAVVELVAGYEPDDPDRSPQPSWSWTIEIGGSRYDAQSHSGFGHRCSAGHWHQVVGLLAARDDTADLLI